MGQQHDTRLSLSLSVYLKEKERREFIRVCQKKNEKKKTHVAEFLII